MLELGDCFQGDVGIMLERLASQAPAFDLFTCQRRIL
jgi:hypothetical protein